MNKSTFCTPFWPQLFLNLIIQTQKVLSCQLMAEGKGSFCSSVTVSPSLFSHTKSTFLIKPDWQEVFQKWHSIRGFRIWRNLEEMPPTVHSATTFHSYFLSIEVDVWCIGFSPAFLPSQPSAEKTPTVGVSPKKGIFPCNCRGERSKTKYKHLDIRTLWNCIF